MKLEKSQSKSFKPGMWHIPIITAFKVWGRRITSWRPNWAMYTPSPKSARSIQQDLVSKGSKANQSKAEQTKQNKTKCHGITSFFWKLKEWLDFWVIWCRKIIFWSSLPFIGMVLHFFLLRNRSYSPCSSACPEEKPVSDLASHTAQNFPSYNVPCWFSWVQRLLHRSSFLSCLDVKQWK